MRNKHKMAEELFYLKVKNFLRFYVSIQDKARGRRHDLGKIYRGFIDLRYSTRKRLRQKLRDLKTLARQENLSSKQRRKMWKRAKDQTHHISFSDLHSKNRKEV